LFAQEQNAQNITEVLYQKIAQSEKGEKLKWMDSLSNFTSIASNFKNDSIVRETVRLALELDSLRIAAWHTANLIFYQNNIIGNPEAGKKLFTDFIEGSKKPADNNTLAKIYLEGADSFYFVEDIKTSITYYELAELHAAKAENRRLEGLAKLYKGGSLSFIGDFSAASQTLQEAVKIFQDRKDTFNIISSRNSLSILYGQNAFFKEAKAEREEAIVLAEKIKSYGHLISFYYNAATDDRKQNNDVSRIANLKRALVANSKTNNPDFHQANILASFVIAYSQMDSIPQAESYLSEIEKRPEIYTVERNREPYLDALKNLAFAKKEYSNAIRLGKEHLAIKRQGTHYEEIEAGEKFLADVYEATGNKEAAYVHFKEYSAMRDSIGSVQKAKGLAYYQTLYETEKRDAQIVTQKSSIALLAEKNKVKNQLLLFGGLALLLLFSVIVLARSRNAAKKRQKMQEGFSQDLIKAQEEERTRVARELHDSVGQKLMLLTKQTKSTGDLKMETLAGDTLEELRSISRGLHPATLEKLGVTAAIKSLINEVDANTNIFFTNEIDDIDNLLSKESSLHLYRILQELLNNMVKHADAKSASVTIERKKNAIEAVIMDNGKGFEFSEKFKLGTSLGMKTLMERAKIIRSTLEIKSKFNQGTTVQLVIPT
jgi:signal transduction histidine kinase